MSAGPDDVLAWTDRSGLPLDWNGPDRPFEAFSDAGKERPILELLKAVVERYPQRIALLDGDSTMTYAEFWRAVAGWSERIAAASAPGSLIGILAPTCRQFPVAMFACLAAGRPFVAIDPHHPAEWIARVLKESAPSLLLSFNTEVGNREIRVFDLAETPVASPDWKFSAMSPDEPACVLFTSGSSGDPKGIVNSQRNLLQRVSQSINSAHIACDDRFLTLASLCSIVGVRDLITALLAGGSVVLLDAQKVGASEILRAIREREVSILFSFPALLRSIVERAESRAGDRLRLVRAGGDTVFWSDIALLRGWIRPSASIQLIYAATEAPIMQWFVDARSDDGEAVPIGYPLPGNELAVIAEDGSPTPDGEAGELVVRSCYVALGTWVRGRRDVDGIEVDPVDGTKRILRTGDWVRRRADGFFHRVGRKDRQVKIRGIRVELDGVEAAIRHHPAVRDVGVVVRFDKTGVARLVAYVEPHAEAGPEFLDEVREAIDRSAPSHMRPSRFYAVPRIPRLANTKPDHRALQAMDAAKCEEEARRLETIESSSTSMNSFERSVADIWCELLGVANIRVSDDFFDLGGDSLRAITLTVKIEKALGCEVPLTLINQAPTFGAFCAALQGGRVESYSPLVVIKSGRGDAPLFIVHGAGGSVMELFHLGRSMTWPGPVIGLQARGLNGDRPHRSVEAMADEYLSAVKAKQPKGPYLLSGFSSGGLVAFEMARRLRDAGDEVSFVGLLDSLPPENQFLRLWTWAAFVWRELKHRAGARGGKRSLGWAGSISAARLRAVALSALWASIAYRARYYAGEVTLFETSARDLRIPSSAPRWSRYASTVLHHSLPGRHLEILDGAGAEITAKLLSECLRATTHRARSNTILRFDLERSRQIA